MLFNNIKIAFRQLTKNRLFSALNVGGLGLGMSACLVVLALIRAQLGFDTFHPDGDRVYRINTEAQRKEGGRERYASSPFPIGTVLARDFTVAEEVVRCSRGLNGDAVAGGLTLPLEGLFTDPSFFRVFGFRLAKGDPATCLDEPFSIVLTDETAARFFGRGDPMDQNLEIRGYGNFKVTGVLEKIVAKTHFQFQALASNATQIALERSLPGATPEGSGVLDNWNNYYATYNYVRLRPGRDRAALEAALAEVAAERYANLPLETRDAGYRFYAHALGDITPSPEILSNAMGGGLPRVLIYGLLVFVFLLTLFPCLNYANLTLARSLQRAREIGLRKVLGARRRHLIRQFLLEAVLTSLLALPLAWLIKLFIGGFLQRNLPAEILSEGALFQEDALTWALWGLFALGVGLLAGGLPAFYLASMRPAESMRDTRGKGPIGRLGWRKALLVGQFAVSMILAILVFSLRDQLAYVLRMEYGFEKENLLTLHLQGQDWRTAAAEIAADHRVVEVSAVSHPMGTFHDASSDYRTSPVGEPVAVRDYVIDRNYLHNLGIGLAAGRNFPNDASPTRQQYALVNEKALEVFGWPTAHDALGQTIWLGDSTPLAVIGVVPNFHFRPFTTAIGPLVLRHNPAEFRFLNIRVEAGAGPTIMAGLERIWKRLDPVHPLDCQWYDQQLQDCYADMKTASGLISFFALLALSVACLGLLGIVTYTVETRTKEIGIRKVVGASVAQIAVALGRSFLILLLVAVALALPAGYFLAHSMLNNFAYRTPVGIGVLSVSAALLLGLGLLTVFSQTVRAGMADPVKSLRSE